MTAEKPRSDVSDVTQCLSLRARLINTYRRHVTRVTPHRFFTLAAAVRTAVRTRLTEAAR